MSYRVPALMLALFLALSQPAIRCAEVPEFETRYQIPSPTEPAPSGDLPAYLDLGVLVAALSVATWIALKSRSRSQMFLLSLFNY